MTGENERNFNINILCERVLRIGDRMDVNVGAQGDRRIDKSKKRIVIANLTCIVGHIEWTVQAVDVGLGVLLALESTYRKVRSAGVLFCCVCWTAIAGRPYGSVFFDKLVECVGCHRGGHKSCHEANGPCWTHSYTQMLGRALAMSAPVQRGV